MNRLNCLKVTLVAALGALAMLAMPGVAAAKHKDRNHDRIPDRWEKRHHLSLKVNQAHRNQDHEGLNNLEEFENETNPRDPDTDNDGLNDGQEVEIGDDPADNDTDNDGVEDGDENAGTIKSLVGTTLTIDLVGGGEISGEVNESTRIECDDHGDGAQASEESVDEEQGDDDSSDAQASDGESEAVSCTTADLVPGTPVHEAELQGGVFEKVELG